MTLRTFIDKSGNTWEWEETPELLEAIRKLHETENDTKTTNVG